MSRRTWAAATLATGMALLAGCSSGETSDPQAGGDAPPVSAETRHGPVFPECGGLSDETVSQLTQVPGLVNTATNAVGCQWLAGGSIAGPHFSFTSFRGSPIGRERKTEELSRDSVEDITIEGYDGFIAIGSDLLTGIDTLCEVGIQFDDDFIEISVSYAAQPFPDPCEVATELTRQSIVNAKK